jgi:hypothetical protein
LANWLIGTGLVIDVIGALVMFWFGVPRYPQRSTAGTSALLLEEDDEDERQRVKWADRLGRGGALLLAVGFGLQFVGLVAG